MYKYILSYLGLVAFISQNCFAQVSGLSNVLTGAGSEYYVGRMSGRPLITINLLSGTRAPGVYHVPIGTNLAEALAYAGGAVETADLSEVTVRSLKDLKTQPIVYDMRSILKSNTEIPRLNADDLVSIDTRDSLSRTALWISIASGLLGIATAYTVISRAK